MPQPDSWIQVRAIFDEALARDPRERESFLAEACGENAAVLTAVRDLLKARDQANSFLERPAASSGRLAPEPLEGRLIGNYRLLREIGRGGMGAVYLARRADQQYEKQVALKVMGRGFADPDAHLRFRRERQILATLDHPNIAHLLDGGETPERQPYVVMEYVQGVRIDEYCRVNKLSIEQRLQLFVTVCGAVQYAHRSLVVHRDLKPSNILVDSAGSPKLLDFGIAKFLDAAANEVDITATGLRMMTPEYASPEQVRGEPVTTATDVYSLGVILFELLTGRRVFPLNNRSLESMVRIICEQEAAKPSAALDSSDTLIDSDIVESTGGGGVDRLRRRLSGDLDAILGMALRKEPQRRYGSAQDMAMDIVDHLEGRPVRARQGTAVYRVQKFIRRNLVSVSAGSVAVLLLAGGVEATLHEARVAETQRQRAEQERTRADGQRDAANQERIRAEVQAREAQLQREKAEQQRVEAERQRNRAEAQRIEAERQKERAQKRSDDLRSLAKAFVFDVNDAVANLAGATAARKTIVAKGLLYLDELARDAGNNLELQRELAAAYERIGDIQGNAYASNLGDAPGALVSYRKAAAIRERVANGNPTDPIMTRELAGSMLRIADTSYSTGDLRGALPEYKRAVAMLETALASDRDPAPTLTSLAQGYGRLAIILQPLGDPAAAIEYGHKAVESGERLYRLRPSDRAARVTYALQTGILANALRTGGKPAEAIPYFRTAIAEFEALIRLNPDAADYRRHVSGAYTYLGSLQYAAGKRDEAIELYSKAVATMTKLLEIDPNDSRTRTGLGFMQSRLATVLLAAGRTEEARQAAAGGIGLYKTAAERAGAMADDFNNYADALVNCPVEELRDGKVALEFAKKATTLNSSNPLFMDTLAWAQFRSGDAAGAIATAERALSVLPRTAPAGIRKQMEAALQEFKASSARAGR